MKTSQLTSPPFDRFRIEFQLFESWTKQLPHTNPCNSSGDGTCKIYAHFSPKVIRQIGIHEVHPEKVVYASECNQDYGEPQSQPEFLHTSLLMVTRAKPATQNMNPTLGHP